MELNKELSRQVEVSYLAGQENDLLTIRPAKTNVDVIQWLSNSKSWLTEKMYQEGAILLRGFEISNASAFEEAVKKITTNFDDFDEEASPRHLVQKNVYTSTDYPNDYPIQFHNEFAYAMAWPMTIFFFCNQPAKTGGETPLADSRRVLSRITKETRNKFSRLGILYVRMFSPYFGVSWKSAFQTDSQQEVDNLCRNLEIRTRWDGDKLYTSQFGKAIEAHPVTKEEVWFNHAFFFNPHALEPLAVRNAVLEQGEDNFSTNTTYGDGSLIEQSVIEEIREAYEKEKIAFSWQKGDLLLLDNMLCSHSRAPFEGRRELLAIFTDKVYRKELT